MIRGQILAELQKIEKEEDVQILYACESGSRAWGFPSKDSDYDVRFLYVHPIDWYLSIHEKRDVIERPIHDMLDISGWDLRKALHLFQKSNPPLLEWLQSPIRYYENTSIVEKIHQLAPEFFSPKSCTYHYLHMAQKNFHEYLKRDLVKIKKYFYVLRPILGCIWLEERKSIPPMEFERLVQELLPIGGELRNEIERLLERKKSGDELDLEPKIPIIHAFLEEKIAYFEVAAKELPASPFEGEEQLDNLFRVILREVW